MLKIKKPSTVFQKYLISYIIILLIPLIIMAALFNTKFMNILKDEVIASNLNTLDKLKNVVDSQLEQIQIMAVQMKVNSRLKPFTFENDPYKALGVKNELINLKVTNNFIHEVFIYFRGDDYLYSSSSSYSVSTFINDIYHFENWSYDDFYKDINSVNYYTIRSKDSISLNNSNTSYFTTFIFPLSIVKTSPYGTAMFLVPQDSFKALTINNYKGLNGNTIIISNNNEVIFSLEDEEYIYTSDFMDLVTSSEKQCSKTVSFNSNDYIFNYIESAITGWQYITVIPLKEIMSQVYEVRDNMVISKEYTIEISKEFQSDNKDLLDVFSLTKFETVEELSEKIKKVCFDTCRLIKEVNKSSKEELIKRIISYIKENYTQCDFSINNVADHFNMTPPYLSNFFKENTGQSFIDYVTHLKLEKAKQLLVSGCMSLENIAKEIGYSNVSSFIRRFKQEIGITPGEYRKNYGCD